MNYSTGYVTYENYYLYRMHKQAYKENEQVLKKLHAERKRLNAQNIKNKPDPNFNPKNVYGSYFNPQEIPIPQNVEDIDKAIIHFDNLSIENRMHSTSHKIVLNNKNVFTRAWWCVKYIFD